MRRTKIIATLGPASSSADVVAGLVEAGVDVFRLNFSHGTHEQHSDLIATVRRVAAQAGRQVGLLQDLSGPKIRTGALVGGEPLTLVEGDPLSIVVADAPGRAGLVSTRFAALPGAVRKGDTLLLDDGRIELRVEATEPGAIRTVVVEGGRLGEHKGINVPSVALPATGLTEKDVRDLHFGLESGVDFVAISFVQSPAVLRQARDEMRKVSGRLLPLVAKLERPEAIADLDAILAESDAVMVARGDLGLELPLERVPRIQKEVTRAGRAREVPVIVATQVLDSMRTQLRPTRAEVSDAANAVGDGVDAIMLAGETAAGAHPVRAVRTLDLVIREAESIPPGLPPVEFTRSPAGHRQAMCEAAVTLAESSLARAIVAVTRGGTTARILSAHRPTAPIIAVTDRPEVARRLSLLWGVVPRLAEIDGDLGAAAARLGVELVSAGVLAAGSVVVLVSVTADLTPGPSNVVKLARV